MKLGLVVRIGLGVAWVFYPPGPLNLRAFGPKDSIARREDSLTAEVAVSLYSVNANLQWH